MKLTKKQLEARIQQKYTKWSDRGLNEYEKIALKHLEAKYKKLTEGGVSNI